MQPQHSKRFGALSAALIMVFTLLGMPVSPAYAGAPAMVHFTFDSRSMFISNMTRVSVDSSGNQGNNWSERPSISADGRYVAFYSNASNLVSGDTNDAWDVFLRDTQMGTTTCLSVDPSEVVGNSVSLLPSISADGRYVAFLSLSTNLISGGSTGTYHVFRRDLLTGTTTIVSVATNGTQANDRSDAVSISADGRYVAFQSDASNLVDGDTNHTTDIFRRDMQTSTTTRISIASTGTQGNAQSYSPSISANGRFVVYYSYATNLVNGDTNAIWDVFLRDIQMSTTTRISVASDETQGNHESGSPSISADGRYVAFASYASNLVSNDINNTEDTFLRDTQTGTTTLVSVDSSGAQGNDWSESPSISADGRYVVFRSTATNLVSGDTNGFQDVFRHDTLTGSTTRLSVNSSGVQGNDWSASPSISADGRYVAFSSAANNLVSGDTNNTWDVFVVPSTNLFTHRIYLPLVIR